MKFGLCPILLVLCCRVVMAAEPDKPAWSTDLQTGDKVCLYDIGQDDLLVGHDEYSLEYWYNSPANNQASGWQMRPSVRKLLFKVLWPGVKISEKTEDGNWYSGTLLVIKNGYESKKQNPKLLSRGGNKLILEDGRSWVADWQVLRFVRARFKKKPRFRNCRRKYPAY